MTPNCALLELPLEIRRQIWLLLLTPPVELMMRSLFIRDNYRNIFMTQQLKGINVQLLRACKQIASEGLPLLYAQPVWGAACRLEALASQIGISNFCFIKRLCVDADDLSSIVGSLILDMQENESGSRALIASPGVELKLELESRALMESMMFGDAYEHSSPRHAISQRRLRFANLEVLEVDGYQMMALSSRGNRRARQEALRLCNFARQILCYHPTLSLLLQRDTEGSSGSDAVDLTMGRVHWRFLRATGAGCPSRSFDEHEVDLNGLEDMFRALIDIDEEDDTTWQRERGRLANWTDSGFRQYPYLTSVSSAG